MDSTEWALYRPRDRTPRHTDTERMSFLEDCVQGGVVNAGFELDGGVYLLISDPTPREVSIREHDDFRHAVDRAMEELK